LKLGYSYNKQITIEQNVHVYQQIGALTSWRIWVHHHHQFLHKLLYFVHKLLFILSAASN